MDSRPRYPVYVPSRGRADTALTPRFLERDGVPYWLVVEPQEADAYRARWGSEHVLVLPFRDQGTVVPARNWIKDHATEAGHTRHWQLDDNIRGLRELTSDGRQRACASGQALVKVEEFVDRWANVGIAGIRHQAFMERERSYSLNRQVYCCVLVRNDALRWRGRRAEDTDYSLQVLAGGDCTILINVFFIEKATSMGMKGGNTEAVYQGDGKLGMVREMQRRWPTLGIGITRRYGQPRMNLGHVWRHFTTPLRPRPSP